MAIQEQTAVAQEAQLIKQGNRQGAYQLLRKAIAADPNDWRAWWGLVHASTNPQERYAALQRTVKLNPNHTKARQLLRQVGTGPKMTPKPPPHSASPLPETAPSEKRAPQNQWGAPADNPFDSPSADQVHAPAPWDNPFAEEAPARSPYDEPAPWDSPFADEPAGQSSYNEPAPWDHPLEDQASADSPRSPGDAASWDTPRPAPPASRSGAVPAKAHPRQAKSSGSDALINLAIAVVGVLVIVGLAALALTRLDWGGFTRGLLHGGAPNTFSGGDPYRTTGGGYLTLDGPAITDSIYDLNEAHNWVFTGNAGQFVRITCEAIGETDPRIALLDPDGSLLTFDDDSGRDHSLGYWDSYLTYTLPRDGEYTVRIDVFTGGQFTLSVLSH